MIHLDVAQGSEEWLMARCGLPTASQFHRIVTPKGVFSKSAERYMYDLLAETMMGRPLETFTSEAMNRGTDMEAEAVAAYEFERGIETRTCGLCLTDDRLVGASPDRLIGDDGSLQVKCPFEPGMHVGYLCGESAEKHKAQVQGEILVAERKWADVVSYHPDLPMAIVRVYPDEQYQKLLRAALGLFTTQLLAATLNAARQGWIKEPQPQPETDDNSLGITEEDAEAIIAATTAGKEV